MKTPAEIVKEVAVYHGVRVNEIMGRNKVPSVVKPRWEAMWRVRNELGWTYPRMGKFFGKDHSSVWFAVLAFDDMLDTVPGLAERLSSKEAA